MQDITVYGLLIVVAAAILLQVVGGWVISRRAEAKGYDKGYDDAKLGYAPHIEALHDDIADKNQQLRQNQALHRLEQEKLMQDCDRRIAHYARRANPFTEADAAGLMKSAGQLQRANELFESLGATTEADYAFSATNHVTQMAARIREAIAEASAADDHQAQGVAA